jgi:hypothetical protein
VAHSATSNNRYAVPAPSGGMHEAVAYYAAYADER